ncbi:putative nucleoredoxin 1 [Nicotiana tabacum]|uniref:protein-disulfide reductase n=1 Tax=Nicotiana tabacum TaxID=4097 RepID=A0A1S3X5I5_TOBAC|nr:probable nucleoredoxin 1 [Nicotiana tomentosiformis]XP_016435137.1 PREDICTED: probable nucleoredoxin 1 [Nicotiana tabacum]
MAMAIDQESIPHDLTVVLSSTQRDFLICRNGERVRISSIKGKIVGLYFSGLWCGLCRQFTPKLVEAYEDLYPKGDFEIVFISSDKDNESFNEYFGKMPWLAVPFSDADARKNLKQLFKVRAIPHFVILDGTGKVLSNEGVKFIKHFGSEAYPFTSERVNYLREEEEKAKENQSLRSILVHESRDFLISNEENKISVSELEGKTVGLYFAMASHKGCKNFTLKLADVYKKLKQKNFEIALISLDEKYEDFKQGFETMPWLGLPFKDKNCERLVRYFEHKLLPQLVVISPDGKTLQQNAVKLVEEYGDQAFPFTQEKLVTLANLKKEKLEAQTLESILVTADRDFVISNVGLKVPVSKLVGNNIVLYFAAQWSLPSREFLPKLITTYEEIKKKDENFEVIFISSDQDESSFNNLFSSMPWLALPFDDERKTFLSRRFNIVGIPVAIAISTSGCTVNTQVRQLLETHGAGAYPFTEEHIKNLQQRLDKTTMGWPKKGKDEIHNEHELALIHQQVYLCSGCKEIGYGWSFFCKRCDYGLHPKCAPKQEDMN